MKDLVSIVIPVHNASESVNRCVDSLLAQDYKELELILIENGSTDNSLALCKEYEQKHDNIKVVTSDAKGVSYARNLGVQHASGKYLMFVDSDDYLEGVSAVSEVISHMEGRKLLVFGYHQDFYTKDTVDRSAVLLSEGGKYSGKDIFKFYQACLLQNVWNKVFSLELVKEKQICFPEDLSFGEDMLFVLEYLKYCGKELIMFNHPLYVYVSKDTGLCRQFRSDAVEIRHRLYGSLISSASNEFEVCDEDLTEFYYLYLREMIHILKDDMLYNKNQSLKVTRKKIKEVVDSNEFQQVVQYLYKKNRIDVVAKKALQLKCVLFSIFYLKIADKLRRKN